MVLDIDSKTFVVHIVIWEREKMLVHSKKQAQIGALLFNRALSKVLAEYSDYSNIFSAENTTKLSDNTRINKHTIELKEGKQPLFSPIHSLELVELEILKTYIKTNLANDFIRLSRSSAKVLILFDKKPNGNLCFYVDYQDFNIITIKN